jgi:hypothetical protein
MSMEINGFLWSTSGSLDNESSVSGVESSHRLDEDWKSDSLEILSTESKLIKRGGSIRTSEIAVVAIENDFSRLC